MKRSRLQSVMLSCAMLSLSGCITTFCGCMTRPTHLFDVDEVYRLEKPVKAQVVFWNGKAWQKGGKVMLPSGTYLMGRVQ